MHGYLFQLVQRANFDAPMMAPVYLQQNVVMGKRTVLMEAMKNNVKLENGRLLESGLNMIVEK